MSVRYKKSDIKYRYNEETFSVPYDLFKYCHDKNKISAIKLFLWLKFEFGPTYHDSQLILPDTAKSLCISTRTVQKALLWLHQEKFIGYSKKNRLHHLRGFDTLRKMNKWTGRASYRIQQHQLRYIKPFIYAINYKRAAYKQRNDETRKRDGELQSSLISGQCAASYYAKRFGVSERTAFKHKKEAVNCGLLTLEHVFRYINRPITEEDIRQYDKSNLIGKITTKKGKYVIQVPDKIESIIESRRRKRFKFL